MSAESRSTIANSADRLTEGAPTRELKQRTTRGAVYSMAAQAATFLIRMASLMALTRLLAKEDFGVVNMATAFTGFLGLFRDAGLPMASVQRASITDGEASTLFWLSLGVGAIMAALGFLAAPLLALFYGEPRLFWVTGLLATSFVLSGAGAQHRAMLQRDMRFGTLAVVDTVSLMVGTTGGICAAAVGWGYWALVVTTVGHQATGAVAMWLASRWIPGWPRRGTGVGAMLRFGGLVTLNNLVFYLAYNVDKMLLGRFWGAEALGVYGRAYQLVNLPTENLNATIGAVAFPALARIQQDGARLRSHFLRGYGLYLSLVLPITVACAMFAEEIVLVFFGPKWSDAAPIFRLLAPTILVFALTNPFAWLMLAQGQVARNLKIGLVVAPVVVLSYVVGLRAGPHGVAAGFSIAMVLLVAPVIAWAKYGTLVLHRDIVKAIAAPCLAIVAGAAAAWLARGFTAGMHPALLRLVVGCSLLFSVYWFVLLFVMNQRPIYLDLLRTTGFWPQTFERRSNDAVPSRSVGRDSVEP